MCCTLQKVKIKNITEFLDEISEEKNCCFVFILLKCYIKILEYTRTLRPIFLKWQKSFLGVYSAAKGVVHGSCLMLCISPMNCLHELSGRGDMIDNYIDSLIEV